VRGALAGLHSRQPPTRLPAGLSSFGLYKFHFQVSTVLILFFQVGKKALTNRQALLQFLVLVVALV